MSDAIPKPLILIVDDTPDNLDVLGGILSKDYRVKAAVNGERALRIARGNPKPDMILLDVIMPNMDGYEVCRQLKSDPETAEIPIIFVTAKVKVEDERMGLELGAVDYITKPISPPIVELRVRTQLALYDQNRELERMVAERTSQLYNTIEKLKETTAAKERIESELAIAWQIQHAMLPKVDVTDSKKHGYKLCALLQPARQVGGDFYDFFPLNTNELCVVIGDVSDKGVPAALTMARVITLVRAMALINHTPSGVLQAINAVLSHDNDDCHFVTMLCAILEIKTGNLTYASAGHDSPLLLRNKRGQWLELETGPALGLFDDSEFPEHTEQLHTDDLLLLYTDGITEAKNPEGDFFTAERLQSVLERHPPDNPIRLVRSVQHFYQHFLEDAPASDDLTLLALHYLPNNTFYTKGKAMEWTISLNNELTALEGIRQRIGEHLSSATISTSIIEDMQLVTEEVLVNIIEYGFQAPTVEQRIDIIINLLPNSLKFTFKDTGIPFNPLDEIDLPDLFSDDAEREGGGFGFFLVRELVDNIEYQRQGNENILTIIRNIPANKD